MDLSIIVTVYNSEKTIRECLLSILDSDFDKDFEIIVIDDGSTDNSMGKIKDFDVRIISQRNMGAAAAKNTGAGYAKSELFIFVDSDVIFFKDTLKKIYGHLKKDSVDYVSIRYSKKSLNQKWIHKYKALADYMYYYDFIFTKEQKQKPIKQVFISGGLEGYKRKVFEELGGFDERIKGAGVEEEKLISKLSQKYNMLADGNIKTKHNFPDFRKLARSYFTRTFDSMNLMLKDNYNQPCIKKNTFRVSLGALTVILLVFSLSLFFVSGHIRPFIVTLVLFLSYLLSHFRMFIIAFKEYGFLFMLYTMIINLFFCSLISLAGFLGIVKNLVWR